jgi:hypothetical protein
MTGIALANAGAGTSTITGNSFGFAPTGTCGFTLYGANNINGTAISPNITFPISITNGQVNAFTLSSQLPTASPAFAGYAVAVCNFIGAHAFAQISDYTGLNNAFSEGYLAIELSGVNNGVYTAPYTIF